MLVVGLVLFFSSHSLPRLLGLREKIGPLPYKILFIFFSFLSLYLIFSGYAAVRYDPVFLWQAPSWSRHISFLFMIPSCIFLFSFCFSGKISSSVSHPLLLAVLLWAFSHLMANGDLAGSFLFGSFLVWSVILFVIRFFQPKVNVSGTNIAVAKKSLVFNDVLAMAAGFIFYLTLLFYLHSRVIGISLV
ncbi:MAG: NnrU family protein [Alphaproteobacteria bacterium]|nr:NnrU family protein [Alphaproteobacteria bacterium]